MTLCHLDRYLFIPFLFREVSNENFDSILWFEQFFIKKFLMFLLEQCLASTI